LVEKASGRRDEGRAILFGGCLLIGGIEVEEVEATAGVQHGVAIFVVVVRGNRFFLALGGSPDLREWARGEVRV
jgi:hypothetical protein